MIDAKYQVSTALLREGNSKGGGSHEADYVPRIVYHADDRGMDASVDRCPGAGRSSTENCRSSLVETRPGMYGLLSRACVQACPGLDPGASSGSGRRLS